MTMKTEHSNVHGYDAVLIHHSNGTIIEINEDTINIWHSMDNYLAGDWNYDTSDLTDIPYDLILSKHI